jgi:HAD superfamily hydrolase (TIGR01509 family)
MIEAIFFDLDGVLVDACDWHYHSLNEALQEVVGYDISREKHENEFNGLPTSVKLKMLGIEGDDASKIWNLKQEKTLDVIAKHAKIQKEKIELFEYLKNKNIKICCVTNSIEKTTKQMLLSTGQIDYFDYIITNEHVSKNKPYPDCYNLAVEKVGVNPNNCIIVEDSAKGIMAAKSSVVPNNNIFCVNNTREVTLKKVKEFVNENFDTDGW